MARKVVVVGGGVLECLPGLIKFDLAEVRDYCRVKGEKRRHHTVHFRQVDAPQLRAQGRKCNIKCKQGRADTC